MNKEYKSFTAKNDIDGRTVTGITAVFGNIDSVGDVIMPGAFAKTLQEGAKRALHLWQHDTIQPPTATIKEMREVGRDELPEEVKAGFPEATGGLLVKREYLNTPRGDEILEGIKAGAIKEMSIGFNIIKSDFGTAEGEDVRFLREVRLWDTSDVNWGANAATAASKTALVSPNRRPPAVVVVPPSRS